MEDLRKWMPDGTSNWHRSEWNEFRGTFIHENIKYIGLEILKAMPLKKNNQKLFFSLHQYLR